MQLRGLLIGGVAAIAVTSAATAADLVVMDPGPGIVVEDDPVGNWDGVYLGVFGGYGMGLADHTAAGGVGPLPPGGNDIDLSGWLLGVTAGANITVANPLILGIAGDIAWANKTGEIVGGPFDGTTHTVQWEGAVRGVVGIDGGVFMPYLTGGLAFAHAERSSPLGPQPNVASATHMGWTAGGGVQFAATENVAIDLQYRYSDFGAQVYDFPAGTDPEVDLNQHRVTVGVNFRF